MHYVLQIILGSQVSTLYTCVYMCVHMCTHTYFVYFQSAFSLVL